MAKFVIECPNKECGSYVQVNSFLGYVSKGQEVTCSCGQKINVRANLLASRECSHCGNHVVFDQRKGDKAKCPVCGELINTMAENDKMVEFSCSQCGIRLRTAKGAKDYKCPVCDHINLIAERVMNEELKNNGLASVIKYEGDNETLVWKHPIEDFCLGSQLIVHESQEAIFFRDGQALDLFGAGRYTLETQKVPLLDKIYKLPVDTEGVFHSEVYYINMATQMGIKWGTDTKVRLFDPMTGMHVELGASGDFNIRVINSRKLLLKVVGTTNGLKQDQILGINGKGFFRSMVMTQVKSYLAATIRESSINVLEIDERLMELSEALREKINPRLAEYGLEMPEFFVSRVVTPDDDRDYVEMKRQFGQRHILKQRGYLEQIEAQNRATLKVIDAQGDAEALKIQKQAEAESYRMKAAVEAEEMRMKGYTYQQETARQIGLEAMQNGITGTGGGTSGIGEIAELGIALGTVGSVVNMTKEALSPVMDMTGQLGRSVGSVMSNGWDCPKCGCKDVTSNFCPNCGEKKPESTKNWNCPKCGCKGVTSNFCPNCGEKKPESAKNWDCPKCGHKGIITNFCPECGEKKPEIDFSWNCLKCGKSNIKTKFCPECGNKKEE